MFKLQKYVNILCFWEIILRSIKIDKDILIYLWEWHHNQTPSAYINKIDEINYDLLNYWRHQIRMSAVSAEVILRSEVAQGDRVTCLPKRAGTPTPWWGVNVGGQQLRRRRFIIEFPMGCDKRQAETDNSTSQKILTGRKAPNYVGLTAYVDGFVI